MQITIVNDTGNKLFCKVYAGPETHLPNEHTFFLIFFKQRPFRDGAELKIKELRPGKKINWRTDIENIRIYVTAGSKDLGSIGITDEYGEEKIILVKNIADIPDETRTNTPDNSNLN